MLMTYVFHPKLKLYSFMHLLHITTHFFNLVACLSLQMCDLVFYLHYLKHRYS